MEKFIQSIELNYNLIIKKLKNNLKTFEELEAIIVIESKILEPSTALELAEIYEETLNTIVVLEVYEIELPSDVKTEIISLGKECLTKITILAELESKNDGNLAIFINNVVNKKPVNFGLLNYDKKKFINLNFHNAEDTTGIEVTLEDGAVLKCL